MYKKNNEKKNQTLELHNVPAFFMKNEQFNNSSWTADNYHLNLMKITALNSRFLPLEGENPFHLKNVKIHEQKKDS